MGGSPFQSLGCQTCKKRRIKCGQEKPQCFRCTKRGLVCPGYDGKKSFVIYTPSRPYKALASMRDSEKQIQLFQHEFSALPGTVSQGPMLRTQLYSSFLDIYFPASVDDPWYYVVTSWPTQPASTDLFQKSLTAWACISLGKTKDDKSILQYGVRLYNQAIPLMSSMMRRDPYQDDILYSLMIWTELESHYFSDGLNAWIAHWTAFKKLIKEYQRHRPSPANEAMRYTFGPFQKLITILAIMTDGISAEQHDDIMCSGETTPLDELLRLSASSAMLFNSMEMIDITDCDILSSLLANCITQRELILTWYDQRQADIGDVLSCHASDNIVGHDSPAFGDLFGPVLQFSSLDSARLHVMFYNAMRLVQDLISRVNFLVLTNMDPLHLCENDILLEVFYADQIAQSIPFCLQDRNRTCLAHLSILVLGQISQTYIKARSSEKIAWCIDTLNVIHRLGFSSAGHRKAMMLDEWNRTQMEQQTPMERNQWEIIEMPNKSLST